MSKMSPGKLHENNILEAIVIKHKFLIDSQTIDSCFIVLTFN